MFHASSDRKISEFLPKAESVRDENEGPVVFATPDEIYASCFIVPTDDSWSQISRFDGAQTFICSDRKKFMQLDKGGSIYSLASETFVTDPEKSRGTREWTSEEKVKPVDKKDYESGLQAMIEHGVKVYFVDAETFKKINEAEDHGLEILKTLTPEK